MKRKIIIIIFALVFSLSILRLYQTYAVSSNAEESDDSYIVNLNNDTSVVIPAGTSKTVYYKIKNTNSSTIKYGIGYKSTTVVVKVYSDTENASVDLINKGETKFIKLYLENNSSVSETVNLISIFGYENGGDLIVPDGYNLVTLVKPPSNFAKYITWLYKNNTKSQILTNDGIEYNFAKDVNLINDRLGSSSVGLDEGNIRYYGANPNNYIYFNCSDYSNQTSDTCELWRIIGVFDDKVKIMRNESIGAYSWDNKNINTGAANNNGKNDWTTARLMKLLNPSDYYEVDTNDNGIGQNLYWNSQSGTCFAEQNNATTSCDFTSIGLKSNITKDLIIENNWNIGNSPAALLFASQIYKNERGTTVYSGRPTNWNGKVGVPYLSDYGYAVDLRECTGYVSSYFNSSCTSNNWMKNIITNDGANAGWTLTANPNYSCYSAFVVADGIEY